MASPSKTISTGGGDPPGRTVEPAAWGAAVAAAVVVGAAVVAGAVVGGAVVGGAVVGAAAATGSALSEHTIPAHAAACELETSIEFCETTAFAARKTP
jgi:hypothetical protein